MTEVIFQCREAKAGERGLFPADEDGADLLGKIKLGAEVSGDIKKKRNPKHHKLFFAIVKFLRMHSARFDGVPIEKIKDAVKLATGLADTFVDAETGKTYYVLRSISWASMDQTEFDVFFSEAVKQIANRWMPPGTTEESIRAELFAMVDGPRAIGNRVTDGSSPCQSRSSTSAKASPTSKGNAQNAA